MKTITKKVGCALALLFMGLFTGINAIAQEATDTLTSADYHITPPAHYNYMYNGPLRFIVMGIVIAVILGVTYHYWKQASEGKDIWHDPQ